MRLELLKLPKLWDIYTHYITREDVKFCNSFVLKHRGSDRKQKNIRPNKDT